MIQVMADVNDSTKKLPACHKRLFLTMTDVAGLDENQTGASWSRVFCLITKLWLLLLCGIRVEIVLHVIHGGGSSHANVIQSGEYYSRGDVGLFRRRRPAIASPRRRHCCAVRYDSSTVMGAHPMSTTAPRYSHGVLSDHREIAQTHVFGSRPSDHYFHSVCLFVCLFVCAEFFQPSSIRFGSN